jgi:single-stranded-DNA-specific exonuclease
LQNIQDSNKDLLLSFGGHHAAAGVAIKKENLSIFKREFSKEIFKQCSVEDFRLLIDIDAEIHIDEINQKLWGDLHLLEPFGAQNKTPIFYIKEATVLEAKVIKDIHIKLKIISGEKKISVVFFDRLDIIKEINANKKIALIAKIKENTWQNKRILELFGIDLKII